jgi:hypothetical protein
MKVHGHRRPVERVVEWLDEAGFRIELRVLHHVDETVAGGMLIARPRTVTS